MITIIGYEEVQYDDNIYKLPILDYGGEILCSNCGKCCWDFKIDDFENTKCINLDNDRKTCLVYNDKHISVGHCSGLLDNWPQPRHFVDLNDECGYKIYWIENNMIQVVG